MTSMELLELLGSVRDTYVVEAHQAAKVKPVSFRKTLLIAAVIALTLLLVGCAVVYVLRLQDLKVGEYRYTVPTYYDDEGEIIYAYDENGNIMTQETMTPVPLISLQGANMEALSEWLEFTESYDPEGLIRLEAESSGSDREIPEQYRYTYGCYSPEMVDKLDEIAAKYDLTLLSTSVDLQSYETRVLFDALGIDRVFLPDISVDMEYGSSCFYPEGTFDFSFLLSLDAGDWQLEKSIAEYRYSRKTYFDPATGSYDPENFTQWNYTLKDGTTVLLAQDRQWAYIYVDLPDVFITVSLQSWVLIGGEEVPMPRTALEQLSEFLDLTVQPHPADLAEVEQMKASVDAQHQSEMFSAGESRIPSGGYEDYIQKRLDFYPDGSRVKDNLSYALYDLNADGVEELITHLEILSMANGKPYLYFSTGELPILPSVQICEDGVIEIRGALSDSRYYFQAEETGAAFLLALSPNISGEWNLLTGSPTEDLGKTEKIDEKRANEIMASYRRVDLPWQLMKRFGQPIETKTYTDPYAAYIAKLLDRCDDAKNYTYTLIDLDGNGVEELITRDIQSGSGENADHTLHIHTIVDGELSNMGMMYGFQYVCEGGVLEVSEEDGSGGAYYQYYKIENGTAVPTDKVVQDPFTRYWGLGRDGQACKTVREEEAREVIASHKRIRLDMKPFPSYPLK